MKKIISVLLVIITVISIYLLSSRSHNKTVSISDLTTEYNSENITDLSVESLSETVSKKINEDISNYETEISKDNEKGAAQIQETKELENMKSGNISIDFFYARDIGELTKWIKNADNNDSRKHFLNVVRQKKEILVVEAKDSKYKLESISVHPDHEYMTYTFIKDSNYISITINLSDSMKQQMAISQKRMSINKAVSEYNKELENTYKEFQLKKGKAKVLGLNVDVFYNNGQYYEKLDGELKLIAPSAFFELNGTEVKINLYVDLKEEKWDNKYLDLFNFKFVEL